jgi:hypothetical protein
MVYLLAILFSLVASVQTFASEITAGNIGHVKNGRDPKAGAAIFPTIPVFQLLAASAAWLLQTFIPHYAVWVLVASYLIFSVIWGFSFTKLKAELNRIQEP